MLLRHGDLLLKAITTLPKNAKKINTDTLQEGEVTGHKHRLQGDFEILSQNNQKFVMSPIGYSQFYFLRIKFLI